MPARPIVTAISLLGSVLAACVPSAAPSATTSVPAAQAVPANAAVRADAAVKALMKQAPFPGVAVAVSKDGKVIYSHGFGVADSAKGTPVLPDTRFPIGSITKPMTCLAVLQLADKGRVDLDEPVGRYLPDLPQPAHDVPIRYLMDHSSGILNYLQNKDFPYNKPIGLTRQDMVGYFASQPLRFTPGTQFDYSNSNTYLLGLLIEAVSGISYDRYVEANLFGPFGMTASDFGELTERAKGSLTREGRVSDAIAYDWLVPFSAGAVVSNTTDLIRFTDGLFGPNTPESVRTAALSAGKLGDGSQNSYLKGCLIEGNLDGIRKYSHAGSIYGFTSHLARYPDKGLTVVVLANAQGENFPALTIEQAVARAFLGLPDPDQTPIAFDEAEAKWISGAYAVTNRRMGFDQLFFFPKSGNLMLGYGPQGSGAPEIALKRLGEGRYVSSKDPAQLFTFRQGADGSAELDLRYYEGVIPMRKAG